MFPFICELYEIRTHLRRELDYVCANDTRLSMLERMYMIDAAYSWSSATLRDAYNILRKIVLFFQVYSLHSILEQLHQPTLKHHPLDASIPLFWSMEHYSSFPSLKAKQSTPAWNTARKQRSAIGSWYAAFCSLSTIYKDRDLRMLTNPGLDPYDNIMSRMTAGGMASRLGAEIYPSQALLR